MKTSAHYYMGSRSRIYSPEFSATIQAQLEVKMCEKYTKTPLSRQKDNITISKYIPYLILRIRKSSQLGSQSSRALNFLNLGNPISSEMTGLNRPQNHFSRFTHELEKLIRETKPTRFIYGSENLIVIQKLDSRVNRRTKPRFTRIVNFNRDLRLVRFK